MSKTVPQILGTLTPEDRERAVQYGGSASARAMLRLGPQMTRITTEWSNDSDPEWEKRIETVMGDAATAFLAQQGVDLETAQE